MSYKTGFYEGRLGIGLSSTMGMGDGNPRYPLDINGDIRLTGSIVNGAGQVLSLVPTESLWTIGNSNLSYTGGNVGIGTASPSEKLQVNGRLRIEAAEHSAGIWFIGNGVANDYGSMFLGRAGSAFAGIGLWVTNWMHAFLDNGNVGFGTTSPSDFLTVRHGASSGSTYRGIALEQNDGTIRWRTALSGANGSNDCYQYMVNASGTTTVQIHADGNSYFTGGNVGIGTTSPYSKLEITAGADKSHIRIADGSHNGSSSTFLYPALTYYARQDNTRRNTDPYTEGSGSNGGASASISFTDRPGTYSYPTYTRGSDIVFHTAKTVNDGLNLLGYYPRERMRITAEGRVGIGTTSPEFHLDIRGSGHQIINVYSDGTGDAYARFSYNNNADAGLFYVGALATSCMLNSRFNYPIIFYIDNTEAMRINTDRHLGIGTTSPAAPLHVHGSDHQVQPQAIFSVAAGSNHYHTLCGYGMHHIDNYHSSTIQPYGSTSSGTAIYFNYYSQGFVSLCRNTCMVHSGFTEFKHPANDGGTKPYTSGIIVIGNEGGYAPSVQCTRWGTWADGVDLEIHIASTNAGRSKAFWVAGRQNHGKVYASGSFNNSSDDRKKHNETKVSNGLEIINKLTAKKYFKSVELKETSFDYELDNSGIPITTDTWMEEIGFIAQEIQKIPELKHCVSGEEYVNEVKKTYKKDASDNIIRDASGNKIVEKEDIIKKPNSLSLRYNDLFVCNIVATQELYKENEELKTEVATLKSELAAIKQHLGI